MALSSCDVVLLVFALLLSLAITAETVIVVPVKFDLTDTGPYSGLQRAAYVTVSTIIASAITTFIPSRIRKLWIADVDQHPVHIFGGCSDYDFDCGEHYPHSQHARDGL
jgi:hypothetical protein